MLFSKILIKFKKLVIVPLINLLNSMKVWNLIVELLNKRIYTSFTPMLNDIIVWKFKDDNVTHTFPLNSKTLR